MLKHQIYFIISLLFVRINIMSLNCAEIEEIICHIPQNGIIRKYSQSDENTLVISYQIDNNNIYDLYICLSDKNNFLCALPTNNTHDKQNYKFSQYLNSNATFARIQSVSQYKLSRIIDVQLSSNNQIFHLICRMWGSGANILFTDKEYVILECFHRYPKRGEWVGESLDLSELCSKNTDYQIRDDFASCKNINQIVYDYYSKIICQQLVEKTKNKISSLCIVNENVINKKLDAIADNNSNPADYLKYGELIKCNAYQIKNYVDKCSVFDYETNENVIIPLKKTFTVEQNMQAYFEKYKKSQEAQNYIIQQKESLQIKLNQIKNIAKQTEQCNELKKLNQLLESANLVCGKKNGSKNTVNFGRQFILANNTVAYVSKNAKDADQLLKRVAKGNDFWFHIRDYAGSHVIVKNTKNCIDPIAKIQAAHLALYYSQLRTDSNLTAISEGDVYFTQIKYLHKPNLNTPGLVFPTQEKNIKVHFEKKIIDEILGN